MQIKLRVYRPSDKAFLYSTFLRGVYYGSEFYSLIEKESFFKHYEHVLDGLVKRPSTMVSIACLEDEPDVILGYAIYSTSAPVLHWVFVKDNFRKQGVAKQLLHDVKINVTTHLTTVGNSIRLKRKWIFDPFQL